MKLTPEQRMTKARVRLMTHPLFCALSGIMMMGKVTITEEVETACTNGRDEEYNPKFMELLNDEELCFLIAHENFHKMYQHCSIWEHLFREDAECAGIATDAVINLQIEKWGNPVGQFDRIVQFPSIGGVYDEAFEGMDTKQVYDIIRKNKKKQGKGIPNPKGKPKSIKIGVEPDGKSFDKHDYESAQKIGAEEAKQLSRQIDQAIRQGQILSKEMCKKYGIGTGNSDLGLGELLEPYVDWREVLRDFAKTYCGGKDLSTWSKPNKRLQSLGLYLPHSYSESTGRLVCGSDVSGSVSRDLQNQFISEIESIRNEVCPEIVDMLSWDTCVTGHERFEREGGKSVVDVQMMGGGGTDPACVFDYLRDESSSNQPDAVVILTDGYVGSWGDPQGINAPVLWLIIGNTSARPTHGQVVFVK